MHYRVEVSMFPGQSRIVRADELNDLRLQGLVVGDVVEVDEDGNPIEQAEDAPAEVKPEEVKPSKAATSVAATESAPAKTGE